MVNWAPDFMGGTVVANEEVVDGKTERGGYPVYRVPMRQWVLRITKYADRLIDDLDDVDWPESIKEQQRNWIGRSEGASVFFLEWINIQMIRLRSLLPDQILYMVRPTWY